MNKKFTLIELLVVIAIIGILTSLLLPVLSKSRKSARITHCTSNSKQLAMATYIYSTDNKRFYPAPTVGGYDWDDLISSYLGLTWSDANQLDFITEAESSPILTCPLDDSDLWPGTWTKSYTANNYMENNNAAPGVIGGGWGGPVSRSVTEVTSSSNTVIFSEFWNINNFQGGGSAWFSVIGGDTYLNAFNDPGSDDGKALVAHGNFKANITMCDGSVQAMSGFRLIDGGSAGNYRNTLLDATK